MRLLLAHFCLLLAAPAAAQTQFTYAELEKLDTPALSRLLLGAAGQRMTEHRIIVGEGSFRGPRDGIDRIDFAGPPRHRFGDICEAERIGLSFEPIGRTADADPPMRISGLSASALWAVLTPGEQDCGTLGRVLDSAARPGPYFPASGPFGRDLDELTVNRAVGMLRRLIADPDGIRDFACRLSFPEKADPREAACRDRRFAGLLDTARLERLQVRDCGDTAKLCVRFWFAEPGNGEYSGTYVRLTFVTGVAEGAVLSESPAILRVRIVKEERVV